MSKKHRRLYELSEDILNMTVLLKEYCSRNSDTEELQCIYTCIKTLNKKADDLALLVMDFRKVR